LLRIERSHLDRIAEPHIARYAILDARLHLGYAKYAIVHAKAASLLVRLVFRKMREAS
jgi:hypothetical protein